jgi:AcrR family transcriptional regulator
MGKNVSVLYCSFYRPFNYQISAHRVKRFTNRHSAVPEANAKKRSYRGHVQAEVAALTAQRILQAAIALFEEQWLDHITFEQIAERAGVTVQTVIRRFGSKEQLIAEAGRQAYREAKQQRDEAPVGDIAGAIGNLLAHYETVGKRVLRSLAQEERDPVLHQMVEEGRLAHRQWVERVFAPFLLSLETQRHARLVAQLVAVTDVYVWKLLSQDMGLDREQTAVALQELVLALLAPEPHPGGTL